MDDKKVDDKITRALHRGTDNALHLKGKVWLDVEKNLKQHVKGEGNIKMGVKKAGVEKGKRVWAWTSVAAALAMVFLFGTAPGQAAVKKIREIFLPEKIIVEELEGQKEKSKVSLHENKAANYVIYFDEERYKLEKSAGKDRIVPLLRPTGDYPEVFMEISQVKDKSPEQLAPEIEKDLKAQFPLTRYNGPVEQPLQSISLSGLSGQKFNSTLVRYYLVDNRLGGTFVIKQQLFLEAEEGHGARFDNMLREFKIVQQK